MDCLDPVTILRQRQGEGAKGFKGEVFVKKLIAAAAAAALVVSPTIAAAQSAPVEVAPATEQAEGEQIRGGFILPLAIIVAIAIAVYFLTKSKDDNLPKSP
jgi:hypothetical protein